MYYNLHFQTGTLTHEGLEMYSVVPSVNAQFVEPVINFLELDVKSYLLQGMATCHSLTRIDGKLTGDPLDMNMFESTHWVCISNYFTDHSIYLYRK